MTAPDFSLHTVADPAVVMSLRSLLTNRPQQAVVDMQTCVGCLAVGFGVGGREQGGGMEALEGASFA